MPTVLIKSWDLNADMFDGDALAGPVPTLFATDPDAAMANLLQNPEKVFYLFMDSYIYLLHFIVTYNP